jgi:hypothetical protein
LKRFNRGFNDWILTLTKRRQLSTNITLDINAWHKQMCQSAIFLFFSQKSHQDQITKKKCYCANRHLLPFSFKVDRPPNINSHKPKDQSLFFIWRMQLRVIPIKRKGLDPKSMVCQLHFQEKCIKNSQQR